MEIDVLVKPVPDADTRLRPNSTATSYDTEAVKWILAGYDESAVEQALLLKESTPGSTVRVISFGPAPRTEEVLRASIALGCDRGVWVEQPKELEPDAVLTARVLAVAVGRSPPTLVLAGKQSGDLETGLVPGAIGELLGFPSFGNVVNLRWDDAKSLFSFQRASDEGMESWEAAPPLVIGLQQAWNDPRTAKLPNILKSRKASIEKVPWAEVSTRLKERAAPLTRVVKFELPAPRTGAQLIEYKTPEEAAAKLVKILREKAKVFP